MPKRRHHRKQRGGSSIEERNPAKTISQEVKSRVSDLEALCKEIKTLCEKIDAIDPIGNGLKGLKDKLSKEDLELLKKLGDATDDEAIKKAEEEIAKTTNIPQFREYFNKWNSLKDHIQSATSNVANINKVLEDLGRDVGSGEIKAKPKTSRPGTPTGVSPEKAAELQKQLAEKLKQRRSSMEPKDEPKPVATTSPKSPTIVRPMPVRPTTTPAPIIPPPPPRTAPPSPPRTAPPAPPRTAPPTPPPPRGEAGNVPVAPPLLGGSRREEYYRLKSLKYKRKYLREKQKH